MIGHKTIDGVIGKTFADKLDEPLFVTDKMNYSRRQMVTELGCANFVAAVRLAKVLRRLKIHSPAELYKMDPLSLARSKGIGQSCLFVAMCIIDAHGYSIIKWWVHNKKDNVVKFSTFKHKALRRAAKRKQEVA
jgi:hypothetical protein